MGNGRLGHPKDFWAQDDRQHSLEGRGRVVCQGRTASHQCINASCRKRRFPEDENRCGSRTRSAGAPHSISVRLRFSSRPSRRRQEPIWLAQHASSCRHGGDTECEAQLAGPRWRCPFDGRNYDRAGRNAAGFGGHKLAGRRDHARGDRDDGRGVPALEKKFACFCEASSWTLRLGSGFDRTVDHRTPSK